MRAWSRTLRQAQAPAPASACRRGTTWRMSVRARSAFSVSTLMIASTARSYLVVEKMAMGDGRYDSARLTKAIGRASCRERVSLSV